MKGTERMVPCFEPPRQIERGQSEGHSNTKRQKAEVPIGAQSWAVAPA